MDIYLVIDLVVVVALLGLGITAWVKDGRSEINRIFAQFTMFIAVWIVSNYVSADINTAPQAAIIANYFVFLFSFLAAVYILRFAIVLAKDKKSAKIFKYLKIPFIITGIVSFTPLVAKDVEVQGEVYAVIFGPLVSLYGVALLGTIGWLLYMLPKNIKKSKGEQKQRLKVLFKGLLLTLPTLVVASFVLPFATGWFGLTKVAVLSMLILVYSLYYSVVKHHLFDLRLAIVRSLGYVLTLGVVAAFYGFGSLYITKLFDNRHTLSSDLLSVALIIIAVLSYGPLKNRLDRLTVRIFFKESYDPQAVINNLSNITTSTLEIGALSRQTINILADTMKSSFCAIVLVNDGDDRVFKTEKAPENLGVTNGAFVSALKPHKPISVSDTEHQENVNKYMRSKAIELAIPMYANNIMVGYLVFGSKENGLAYNRQDSQLLEIAADSLAVAMQNALRFEEIQNFASTLQAKVNEATRKLQKTNEKLKSLDETKDDFISMASHQLRTPLTSVKGYISMVLEEDAGKITPMQKEMLGQAFFSSQRMVYLIADLLNVSRLKTGKFIIDPAPVNLSRVIEEELIQLKETATARQLKLEFIKPKNFPDLMLDETKIRQVIMNFVDNAIYYTPAGGKIKVRLIDEPRTVELRVEDTGLGVPKSEQPHLFTKFYRAGNARKARPDGTGLGLFMAKKVIMAQGGSTIFHSQEGKGSTFGFIFNKKHLNDMAAEIKHTHTKTTSTTRDQK